MKRVLKLGKILGIVLLVVLLLVGVSYAFISRNIHKRAEKQYQFTADTLHIEPSEALLKQGEHLVTIKGCTDCHGGDLGGKVFLNEAPLGTISATNLTSGKGGVGANYTVGDWLAALRHGVNKQKQALLIMPSHETAQLSKEDLRAIIAYCRQVPAVDRSLPERKLGPMLKLLTYFDKIPLFPVEKIDHTASLIESTNGFSELEMGRYLSVSCVGCHRENFAGGESPVPGMPMVPDISAAGNVGKWTLPQFVQTLRTGKTPSGHQMKTTDMPWQMTAKYTDTELKALYSFLRTVKK